MKAIVRIALCTALLSAVCAEASFAQSSTRRGAPSSQSSTSSQVQRQSQGNGQRDGARQASPSQERKKEATKPSGNHGSASQSGNHGNKHGSASHDNHNHGSSNHGHQHAHNDQHHQGGNHNHGGNHNPGHHADNRPSHNHHGPSSRPHYINGHRPAPFHMHSTNHHHYYGYHVRTLPAGYRHHVYHGIDYYVYDGVYYRRYNGSYIVCRPPFGYTFASYSGSPFVVYVNVPGAYGTMNRVQYFYDDGVFFYMNPRGEYEVVQAPLGALVESIPQDCELVRINGEDFYLVDFTLYKLVVVQGRPMFEVVDNRAYNLR